MQKSKVKPWIVLLLVSVYNYFFWGEKSGLNLFLFGSMLLACLVYFNPHSWQVRHVKVSFAFTILSMLAVLIFNSLIATITFFGSFVITAALMHEHRLRSLDFVSTYALGSAGMALGDLFRMPVRGYEQLTQLASIPKRLVRNVKLTIIPVFTFGIFFLIFEEANPVIDKISYTVKMGILEFLGNLLFYVYLNFSVVKFLFILLGIWITYACLYHRNLSILAHFEQSKSEYIQRQRSNYRKLGLSLKMIALKNEYQMAIVMLILVNGLLICVNAIDISWLWIGFKYTKVVSFKDMVHKGTYMLILSILLSMGILLFFFRKNLNFYQKNTLLKKLSYLWIFQNGILVISVALRTYYYIHEYGLAYKRIGLLIFLGLTLFGLYSLFHKIQQRKSLFYLLRVNTWFLYGTLVCMSLVDWDMVIARHNIEHFYRRGWTDMAFLLTHADKTLPLIHQHSENLQCGTIESAKCFTSRDKQELDRRIQVFLKKYESYTWLSWNYADYKTFQYLNDVNIKIE